MPFIPSDPAAYRARLDMAREYLPRCCRCGVEAQPDDDMDNLELAPDRLFRWQHRACPVALPQAA